ILCGIARISPIMNHLAVSLPAVLNEDISIHMRTAITRIPLNGAGILRVNQVQLSISSFDPVITDHQTCRAILQIISRTAITQKPEMIELIYKPLCSRVNVMVIDTPFDTIIVDETMLNQSILRCMRNKQTIA